MYMLAPSAVRLIALALIAALAIVEHLRLANWVRVHAGGTRRALVALILPGVGAFLAWRGGAKVRAIAYVSLVIGYFVVRALS